MAFNDLKIKDEDFDGKNIQSIKGNTVAGRAEELKRLFDAPAQEVLKEKVNALIDYFLSTEAAGEIGTPAISEGSGTTVAQQLDFLFREMQGAYSGSVVNGSITDSKLSNEPGQIKQIVSGLITLICKLETAPLNSVLSWSKELIFEDEYDAEGTEKNILGFIAPIVGALHIPDGENEPRFGCLPVSCGGTGANNVVDGKINLGLVKKLWSGSWPSGTIEVPNWKDYSLYTLILEGVNCPLVLIRYGSRIRGIGGDITATGIWTASTSFTINDDDTWTYNFAGYVRHISAATHSEAMNNCTVTGIWGIV